MSKTRRRINKHMEMAINAMESNPICRDNDLELYFQVLSNKGITLSDKIKDEIRFSGIEFKTLVRQRQQLQHDGKYLPTTLEIRKKRRKLAAEFAEHYSELRGE